MPTLPRDLILRLVNSFVFYGIALNSENLSGDPYLNFCLIGGVGIFAEVLCIFMVKPMGRRISLVLAMCMAGLVCIGAAFIQDIDTAGKQFPFSYQRAWYVGVGR